ncbi:MAG TPA: helix-turn-helix domain-containing protein, partial [Hyphomicrobiaceae bacterium]|nr:helix-turn-helix domain-containing protein [Hyphomicrobiaceae bacterium]
CANVSRSTASDHLSKLVAARLLTVTRDRRFSYYRIASPLVATMLESIKVVAAIEVPPRRQPRSASDDALRFARSCYDHLAGQVGVAVTDALVAMGHIVLTDEGGEVTSSGGRFLAAFGVDLRPRTRRIFCQPCLDWSERRYHLKGLVAARILGRLLELGWLNGVPRSRALQLTSSPQRRRSHPDWGARSGAPPPAPRTHLDQSISCRPADPDWLVATGSSRPAHPDRLARPSPAADQPSRNLFNRHFKAAGSTSGLSRHVPHRLARAGI